MKPHIEDVAKAAGVSTATVSRTFSHPNKVSEITRKRVLAVSEKLNFSISRAPRILKSGRNYRIALLIGSSMIEWFTAQIIEGLNSVFRDAGYDLILVPINNASQRREFFSDLPLRGNIDAVVVSSFDISPYEIKRLRTTRVPIIGINTQSSIGFNASVGIDDAAGARLAVSYLVHLGHRNITYIYEAFPSNLRYSSYNRLQGFKKICSSMHNLHTSVKEVPLGGDFISNAITELFSQNNRPTALCFHQDSQAIPFFFKLGKSRIIIPDDISLIGFDDSTFSDEVGLTTIHQDPRGMAISAAKKALALINCERLREPYETFPVALRIRDSTAVPKKESL